MKKIYIDVGHGGYDSGAVNGNLVEKEMNLTTSLETQRQLKRMGFDVKMSRTADVFVSIDDSAKMANEYGADLVLSQHYNAGGGDRGEVIHSINYGRGTDFAVVLGNQLKAIGQTSVKLYSKENSTGTADYFGIIRLTNAPSVIFEPCFIDNATDRTLADTAEKQKKVGIAAAKAICEFYNVVWEDEHNQPVFSDIEGHYAQKQIEELAGMGIVNGYPDGTFKPDDNATRGDVCIIARNVVRYITGK